MTDSRLFVLWLRATWAGWLLGVPLVIVLALLGETVGLGGSQVLVGAGMGTGIGWMQGRVIRDLFAKPLPWFWSSVVGLASPFLALDVSNAMGWGLMFSLPVYVALGGIIAGGWQAAILQPHVRKGWMWVGASAIGWTLSAQAAGVADYLSRSHSLRGLWGAAIYLGVVAGGGLILGLVTASCLAWIFRPHPAAQPPTLETSA